MALKWTNELLLNDGTDIREHNHHFETYSHGWGTTTYHKEDGWTLELVKRETERRALHIDRFVAVGDFGFFVDDVIDGYRAYHRGNYEGAYNTPSKAYDAICKAELTR